MEEFKLDALPTYPFVEDIIYMLENDGLDECIKKYEFENVEKAYEQARSSVTLNLGELCKRPAGEAIMLAFINDVEMMRTSAMFPVYYMYRQGLCAIKANQNSRGLLSTYREYSTNRLYYEVFRGQMEILKDTHNLESLCYPLAVLVSRNEEVDVGFCLDRASIRRLFPIEARENDEKKMFDADKLYSAGKPFNEKDFITLMKPASLNIGFTQDVAKELEEQYAEKIQRLYNVESTSEELDEWFNQQYFMATEASLVGLNYDSFVEDIIPYYRQKKNWSYLDSLLLYVGVSEMNWGCVLAKRLSWDKLELEYYLQPYGSERGKFLSALSGVNKNESEFYQAFRANAALYETWMVASEMSRFQLDNLIAQLKTAPSLNLAMLRVWKIARDKLGDESEDAFYQLFCFCLNSVDIVLETRNDDLHEFRPYFEEAHSKLEFPLTFTSLARACGGQFPQVIGIELRRLIAPLAEEEMKELARLEETEEIVADIREGTYRALVGYYLGQRMRRNVELQGMVRPGEDVSAENANVAAIMNTLIVGITFTGPEQPKAPDLIGEPIFGARGQQDEEEARREQERQEQERREQERQEQERQEQARREQARREQERQEQARQEQARQEQERQEQERQEQARQEQARQEQARREQERQEQVRQEQERQEQARREQKRSKKAEEAEHKEAEKVVALARETFAGKLSLSTLDSSPDESGLIIEPASSVHVFAPRNCLESFKAWNGVKRKRFRFTGPPCKGE